MSEQLILSGESKAELYTGLIPQIQALIGDETDNVATLANVSAALKEAFGFFWVGFYLVKESELVLGPFQGPIACTRIQFGRGVCGQAWANSETLLVPNVDLFPGHIACSSLSKSEIVGTLFKNGIVIGVLDVDSDQLNNFDETDKLYLNLLCTWLSERL